MVEQEAPKPKFLIAGNWKMNMTGQGTEALAQALAQYVLAKPSETVDAVICPPALWIERAVHAVKTASGAQAPLLGVGAQDCHMQKTGAHTGDIAAEMIAESGCCSVIVGHSERRADWGETDSLVLEKARAAQQAGLQAIVCVGETLAQREAGQALDIVGAQIKASVPPESNAENVVIAYEPVWAIGTGHTPTLDDIAAMHRHMREVLSLFLTDFATIRLLYGGSVKPGNAKEILAQANVNGALVGGASLKAADFQAIIEAAAP